MNNEQFPTVTLAHPDSKDVIVKFDPLDREMSWTKHLLFLPWTSPTRMLGFVHPDAEKDIGIKPFMLYGTFIYMGSVGFDKPDNSGRTRVLQGPKLVLPYDMITPVDIHIGSSCSSWMFIRDQNETFQKLITTLILQIVMPSKIEAPPSPSLVVPG